MTESICTSILTFIKEYGGAVYRGKNNRLGDAETQIYNDLFLKTKKKLCEFEELVNYLGSVYDMVSLCRKSVLDGTRQRIRKYFWGELRSLDNYTNPESISIFAETAENEARFRIALEIDELRCNAKQFKNHNSIINLPLPYGCVYALSNKGVKDLTIVETKQEALDKLASGKYKKIQVCSLIAGGDEENLIKELQDAIKRIMPLYSYILGLK